VTLGPFEDDVHVRLLLADAPVDGVHADHQVLHVGIALAFGFAV